jgi:23S rRNA (uridine2552-2'-O)-methyltransferase
MAARSKSSGRWLREHFSDPYVKQAQRQGYRSRAALKLAALDERDRLFRPGLTVVDLGAAPGGWSQLGAARVGSSGRVIALDVLDMEPLENVIFIQGDFREDGPLRALEAELAGERVDLVLSDMAPNISGQDAVDQPRAMYLAELALDFARQWLNPEGVFVVKLFQGEGFDEFLAELRSGFRRVVMRKPPASRNRSREMYALATGPGSGS